MYNKHLETFLAVAETGSFTAAAEKLFISPSAVIQQINILERELQVTLFTRSRRGAAVTEAGQYLKEQASDYIRRGEEIRRRLLAVEKAKNSICVGTSLMEKCRLLYEIWVLFCQETPGYEIRMVMIDTEESVPPEAELVECVKDGAHWQKEWEFLEICRVPFGVAIARDHPLAGKKKFTKEDLQNSRMIVIDRGPLKKKDEIYQDLREMGIELDIRGSCSGALIWECSLNKQMMLAPLCWDDILFDLDVRPCEWDYSIPYGLFYRPDCSENVRKLLEFTRKLYRIGSTDPVVPVL